MTKPISDLQSLILSEIPMARAMDMSLRDYDGAQLTIAAPLAPNINDKGCAFGGSLVSLMTLAGWSVVVLKLKDLGRDCDVYVRCLRAIARATRARPRDGELPRAARRRPRCVHDGRAFRRHRTLVGFVAESKRPAGRRTCCVEAFRS